EFLEKEDKLDKVVFVLFTASDLEVYKKAAKEIIK
ncbi:RNase III inhibitor, partial [Candidatus Bathyarchaeota archaeon]